MLRRRTLIGGIGATMLAQTVIACDKVAAVFAKVGSVAGWVRKWIRLIESAVPALGLSEDTAITVAKTVAAAKEALQAVSAITNAGTETHAGELEAAKAELLKAYTALYKLAEQTGLLDAQANVAAGPDSGEAPGTPASLARFLAE